MTFLRRNLRNCKLLLYQEYPYSFRQISLFPSNQKKPENQTPPNPIEKKQISKEIHFYRDSRNNFQNATYIDINLPYGPPLAILLPWLYPDEKYLSRFIEIYGVRGFDVVTIRLSKKQFLYPENPTGGKKVVTDFLDYLEDNHKYRPYIVHGFSVGAYIYGEMMAQMSEDCKKFSTIAANIKGCMWDSPIDFKQVTPILPKALYPKNFLLRWYLEKAIKYHLEKHQHDSINLWQRAQTFFCNPCARVPNVFLFSNSDLLSNPKSLDKILTSLENQGVPTYQKSWPESKHVEHFKIYPDDYVYGLHLFFDMCNLFPDHNGKYKSYDTNKVLTSVRLQRKPGETIMPPQNSQPQAPQPQTPQPPTPQPQAPQSQTPQQ